MGFRFTNGICGKEAHHIHDESCMPKPEQTENDAAQEVDRIRASIFGHLSENEIAPQSAPTNAFATSLIDEDKPTTPLSVVDEPKKATVKKSKTKE